MKRLIPAMVFIGGTWAQQPQLRTRDSSPPPDPGPVVTLPAGTRIPLTLVQPISTKNAKPGDAVYAQVSFPVMASGVMLIPAGTWVRGVVDHVKRAGRVKGRAELQFHLDTLTFSNGATHNLNAAIEQVPGDTSQTVKEQGIVRHDREIGRDLGRVVTNSTAVGVTGGLAGLAISPTYNAARAGFLSAVAAGALVAVLTRGSDVRFDPGAAVEIALTQPVAIERAGAQP